MSLAWRVRFNGAILPEGWEVRRVIDLVSLVNGYAFPSESFSPVGQMPLVRIRDLLSNEFETYVSGEVPPSVLLRNGDVVIGMDGDFNLVLWNRGVAALNQRVCALRPRPGIDVDLKFVAYALPATLKVINDLTFSTTVKHLSSNDVLGERLPLPPLPEQRRISDFLDVETERIDNVCRLTAEQIELLKTRRRAFIEDLLREVPRHAEVALRYILRPSFTANRPDLQVLSVYRDYGVIIKDSRQDNFNKTPEDLQRYLVVRPGNLVVNKMKAWQGSLGVSSHDGIVSPDYLVTQTITDDVDPKFLHYLLRSPRFVSEYGARSQGIRPSQWRLYWDDFASIKVPQIAIEKQAEVVRLLEKEDLWVERSLSVLTKRLDRLNERRQALITAAVTGQIDVSTASGREIED